VLARPAGRAAPLGFSKPRRAGSLPGNRGSDAPHRGTRRLNGGVSFHYRLALLDIGVEDADAGDLATVRQEGGTGGGDQRRGPSATLVEGATAKTTTRYCVKYETVKLKW